MKKLNAVITGAALLALSQAAYSETALEQLQRANSGNQTTGKTFDNSNNPQPSDAYPRGSSGNIQTPSSSSGTASGYSSGSSSGTASGYSSGSSSGTASGYSGSRSSGTATTTPSAPRRGSESTRK